MPQWLLGLLREQIHLQIILSDFQSFVEDLEDIIRLRSDLCLPPTGDESKPHDVQQVITTINQIVELSRKLSRHEGMFTIYPNLCKSLY